MILLARGLSALFVAVLTVIALPGAAAAQTAADLNRLAEEAAARGLPASPLTNKIREGLAKGAPPDRIEAIVRQMTAHLETADRLVREIDSRAARPDRDAAVTLLAESFGNGATVDEVRELHRQARGAGRPPLSADELAGAAKSLSFIKEARLSIPEGTAVISEGVKQGYLSHQILALGREVKRREGDYRAGRASLVELRNAIARGDRPEQLFRVRPEAPAVPPSRPERPQRPAVPERPEAPQRPLRPTP